MVEEELIQTFSRNLKRYMEEYDMSIAEVARRLNVTRQAVSLWVNGKNAPLMDKVDMLCRVFNCARTDLISDQPTDEEELLIEYYSRMDDNKQARLLSYARFLLQEGEDNG